MNRFDFTPYRRTTVGFDRLFDLLERQARANSGDNYPPFNIERSGDDAYRITLSCEVPDPAGFLRTLRADFTRVALSDRAKSSAISGTSHSGGR